MSQQILHTAHHQWWHMSCATCVSDGIYKKLIKQHWLIIKVLLSNKIFSSSGPDRTERTPLCTSLLKKKRLLADKHVQLLWTFYAGCILNHEFRVPLPKRIWYEAPNLLPGNEKFKVPHLVPSFSLILSHTPFFTPHLSETDNIKSIHECLENNFWSWK